MFSFTIITSVQFKALQSNWFRTCAGRIMATNLSFSSLPKQRSKKAGVAPTPGSILSLFIVGVTAIIMIYLLIPVDQICMALDGASFGSSYEITPFEPLPMDTPATLLVSFPGSRTQLYQSISFSDDWFTWWVSDFAVSGSYECKSGEIVAHPINYWEDRSITGTYDPSSGVLLWGTATFTGTPISKPHYPTQERFQNVALVVLAVGGLIALILALASYFQRRYPTVD